MQFPCKICDGSERNVRGPFSLSELFFLRQNGEIGGGTVYWDARKKHWVTLGPSLDLELLQARAGKRQYHVNARGRQHGPFTREDVMEMHMAGHFGPEAHVWKEGMEEWVPLDKIPAAVKPVEPSVPLRASAPPRETASRPLVKSARNRGVYIILGLLFGAAGFHNFYAARYPFAAMEMAAGALGAILTLSEQMRPLGTVVLAFLALAILAEICLINEDGDGDPML